MTSHPTPTGAVLLLPALMLAGSLALTVAAAGPEPGPSKTQESTTTATTSRLREIPMRVEFRPGPLATITGDGTPPVDSPTAGACPTIESTHVPQIDWDAAGIPAIVQAGMAETEMAAATYNLTPSDFPLVLDQAQILFGTSNTIVTTTTHWSFLLWEGTPTNGVLVAEFSSDDIILPHLVIPPGNFGVIITLIGDIEDPIVLNDSGTSQFTIAFRIDEHNSQSGNPCFTAPPSNQNAFPTTDTNGLQQSSLNWLFGVDCGPIGCPNNGGWATFSQLLSFCTPSGDWIMRSLWHSVGCSELAGACCKVDGSCEILELADCSAIGGTYQGDGVTCFSVECPLPTGACCLPDTFCGDDTTEVECISVGGSWLGPDTDCIGEPCAPGVGACCIEATGGCLALDGANCDVVGGLFQGEGTDCAAIICFPMGACCLPDGACADGGGAGISPGDCDALGGVFQGDGVFCGAVSCPLPDGACCLSNGNCITLTEGDCIIVAGTWAGMDTTCPDACETPCPTDLDGSGDTGFNDLVSLLSTWGPCPGCPADFDASGDVGFNDLVTLLAAWGPCL